VEVPAQVEKVGKRDRRIVIGRGGPVVRVKSVSGDLRIVRPAPEAAGGDDAVQPEAVAMDAPVPEAPAPAREILEKVARGEMSVDDAAAALDEARR
jgi:hypothetical protein